MEVCEWEEVSTHEPSGRARMRTIMRAINNSPNATPINPVTIPAVAIPLPFNDGSRRISDFAINPQIIAGIEQITGRIAIPQIPRTIEAIACPLERS
jgi:hypothetical protein